MHCKEKWNKTMRDICTVLNCMVSLIVLRREFCMLAQSRKGFRYTKACTALVRHQSNEPSVTNMQFETNVWLTTLEGEGFDIQDDFGLSFVTYFNTLYEVETLSDQLATIISQSLYGNCAIGKASSDGRHQDTRNFFSLRRWWWFITRHCLLFDW